MDILIEFFNSDFMGKPAWMWLGFLTIVLSILTFDLKFLHKDQHAIGMKESLLLSCFYITLGLIFGGWVWWEIGKQSGIEYLTGFVVEKSLSMDNIFVIAMMFKFFSIPIQHQHRVLFWGILGVIVLRAIMIGLGTTLITQFAWILYIFALFLVLTGYKLMIMTEAVQNYMKYFKGTKLAIAMMWLTLCSFMIYASRIGMIHSNESQLVQSAVYISTLITAIFGVKLTYSPHIEETDMSKNPLLIWLRKHLPITDKLHGEAFTVRETNPKTGKLTTLFTPLFLTLVMIEIADIIFAVDSVPAVFAITTDPFIVYTSNIFAILGLRALYFALAAMIERFAYLKYALSLVLIFIGSKIFVTHLMGWEKFPADWSLGITLSLLSSGFAYSIWKTRKKAKQF